MVSYDKSIKQQNDKTVNHGPASTFYSLPKKAQKLFLTLIGYQKRYGNGNTYPTQDTLSNDIDSSIPTISRATKLLESLGLIYVQRRFHESSVIVVSNLLLQNEQWRSFLRGICAWIPLQILNISLLTSCGSVNDVQLIPSGEDLSINVILKERVTMGQEAATEKRVTPDAIKIEKVKKVIQALIKRGSYMTNDLALGFMAFDLDILDRACQAMRERKNIEYPAAYFNSLCREITTQDGRRPDYVTVHKLRESGLVLIEKVDEVPVIARATPEKTPDTQKREVPTTSYTEQVRKQMEVERQAAEARKSQHAPVEEELRALDKQIEELRPRAEGNPVLTACLNWQLRRRDELAAKLAPNAQQISTKKEEVVVKTLQVGTWKQIDPIASMTACQNSMERAANPSKESVMGSQPILSPSPHEWNPTEADDLYDPEVCEEM